MHASFKFQSKTAIIIFLAFIFRILFVNIYPLTSLQTSQSSHRAFHLSTSFKRRRNADDVVKPGFEKYDVVDVCCEENSDNEEDIVKANTPAVLSIFYAFFNQIAFIHKSNHPFDVIKCDLYPKKYLALSILRI